MYNKAQRINFDQNSPNGILLFREASKILVAYSQRILQREQSQVGERKNARGRIRTWDPVSPSKVVVGYLVDFSRYIKTSIMRSIRESDACWSSSATPYTETIQTLACLNCNNGCGGIRSMGLWDGGWSAAVLDYVYGCRYNDNSLSMSLSLALKLCMSISIADLMSYLKCLKP